MRVRFLVMLAFVGTLALAGCQTMARDSMDDEAMMNDSSTSSMDDSMQSDDHSMDDSMSDSTDSSGGTM